MRHAPSEQAAQAAADFLQTKLKIYPAKTPVGLVLGTGWGDVLDFGKQAQRVAFGEIPGFGALERLQGHAREVVYGGLAGRPVVALRGRVHLNERPGADPDIYAMARLQIEMLVKLGVKKFILTCAAGSLKPEVKVGSIVMIDGFVTVYAPPMPLYAGEFCSPEDAIDRSMIPSYKMTLKDVPLVIQPGGHVMVRGPFFEGRKYDKPLLASTGASVVGMSVLPEACVAALYPDVRVVPVAFITNSAFEEHSHETNQERAKEVAANLGGLLTGLASII